MDPATAAALASMMQGIIGTKQLGGIAPPMMPSAAPPRGLLSRSLGATDISGNIQLPELSLPTQTDAPIEDATSGITKNPQKPGAPVETVNRQEPGFFGSFINTLDNNLQSPAKLGLLGLLNRQDPRLGAAGLVGMGLLGRRQ